MRAYPHNERGSGHECVGEQYMKEATVWTMLSAMSTSRSTTRDVPLSTAQNTPVQHAGEKWYILPRTDSITAEHVPRSMRGKNYKRERDEERTRREQAGLPSGGNTPAERGIGLWKLT